MPDRYELGIGLCYVTTRQVTKSPYFFSFLDDWRNFVDWHTRSEPFPAHAHTRDESCSHEYELLKNQQAR
jgi:hypothetical protein